MRSKFGFAIASLYFLFICGLLVLREFAVSSLDFQRVETALLVMDLPWSVLTFIFAPPVLDDPGSGRTTAIVIYLIGAIINAALIYGICSLIALLISKIRNRSSD